MPQPLAGSSFPLPAREGIKGRRGSPHSENFSTNEQKDTRKPRALKRLRTTLRRRSEPVVRPLRDIVEQVLDRVRILTGRLLARLARRIAMHRAFQDDVILIRRGRTFEHDLLIADEAPRAHG